MRKIIFQCSEMRNQHEEEFEFEDDVTNDEIQEEFEQWVWNEIGDNYGWHDKE